MHDTPHATDGRDDPRTGTGGRDATDAGSTGSPDPRTGRRAFLASAAGFGVAGLAGCLSGDDGGGDTEWIGSGPDQRLGEDGTPMEEMPALEGELTVYSGRHEFLVGPLIEFVNDQYDDFEASVRYGSSSEQVNQIVTEGEGTQADVFYSVNAGSLAALAAEERTVTLSDDLRDLVREEFSTDQWIGTSGRIRSVPYNTDALDEGDLPEDVMAYADVDAQLGWAPSYGSCQAFVTAMRLLEGEDATRAWLEGVVDGGIEAYADEFRVCEAIADGDLDAGFTNHYYVQRVLDSEPDAPIGTAFTAGDAGATFNVAGAAVVDEADDPELAENFVRHLLSAQAQAYFAVETFEYPLAPDVDPVGELPRIEELDVPDLDLSQLSDLETTVDLMRDAGVEV